MYLYKTDSLQLTHTTILALGLCIFSRKIGSMCISNMYLMSIMSSENC